MSPNDLPAPDMLPSPSGPAPPLSETALHAAAASSASPLHYSAHPHIIDRIIELSPPSSLLSWRLASSECKRVADRILGARLVISQADDGRWLDFFVAQGDLADSVLPSAASSPPLLDSTEPDTGSTSPTCAASSSPTPTPPPPRTRMRLPTSLGRSIAIQIVDPALLLQRSFSGMLFRLPPPDASWLASTLYSAREVSLLGDIWYGNRTLPHHNPLVSVPPGRVPRLVLLPDLTRDIAATHYPSLHPFVAPDVEVVARIEEGARYDRAWVGLTTLLPPEGEVVRVRVGIDARQAWSVTRDGRGRPLAYPPTVRRVHISLDVTGESTPYGRVAVPHDVFHILMYKLFRGFRQHIAWSLSGLAQMEVYRTLGHGHIAGKALETLLFTIIAGASNPHLQAALMDGGVRAAEACAEFVRPHLVIEDGRPS